jgi:uncharacterized protein (DUF305 family)
MKTRFFFVGAFLALALTTALVPWSSPTSWAQVGGPDHPGQSGQMMAPLDQLTGDEFDKAFLAQMSMHHAMAIPMSRPAATNAAHQEVKDLAQGIISAQSAEIQQMGDWAKSWYGQELPPMVGMMAQGNMGPMGMGGQGMPMGGSGMPMDKPGGMMSGMEMPPMAMMSDLWQLPPNRLEAVFLSQMIPHHQGALDMPQLVPARAAHQELKDLAQQITSSQSAEISQMNAWLASWYGL